MHENIYCYLKQSQKNYYKQIVPISFSKRETALKMLIKKENVIIEN